LRLRKKKEIKTMKIKKSLIIAKPTDENNTRDIIFDTENMIEKFSEKMGPHFTCISDCGEFTGISINGEGICYMNKNN
jgi:hypothetical protein